MNEKLRKQDGRVLKRGEYEYASCEHCICMSCNHYRKQGSTCAVMVEKGRARPCAMCKFSEIIVECDCFERWGS